MNLGEEYPNLLSDRYHNRLQCLFATESPIVFTAALHKFFIPICLSASDEMMFQHTQVRPILDGSGRALVIIQDVTSQCHQLNELRKERTRLRQSETELAERAEELARSNSDLEQFAYVASHDLKEPLRMVKSFTLLLAEEYTGKLDDAADTYIKYASDGATRMQTLIDDLLSYSRTGTANEALDAVNLQEIVTQVISDQEPTIQQVNAHVEVNSLPTVFGNSSQLTQLFQNLIGNALKFHNGAEPIIKVSCRSEENTWEITVEDNGIGIDAVYYDRIFTIFQRLHTREEYPGTGIGLAICKKIMTQHGGNIRVESELGEGTAFQMMFPK
jgi:light-regulated signal transduction histidine kinase (bacteriophytochrome)